MFYIVLGCFLDGISSVVLTMAVVEPMIREAGIDLIWFGIFIVVVVEMAQITPPIGFNLFVLQGMTQPRDELHRPRRDPYVFDHGADGVRLDRRAGTGDLAAGASARSAHSGRVSAPQRGFAERVTETLRTGPRPSLSLSTAKRAP